MSLSQVIRRYLLLSLLVIVALGCVSTYFIFRFFMHYSTDQVLYEYKDRVENYVRENDTLTVFTSSLFQPQRLEERIIDPSDTYYEGIKDTLLYNEMSGDFLPYRQLYFTVSYKSKTHLITLNQPTIVLDDLLIVIMGLFILLFLLLFTFIYSIDFYLKRRAWAPLDRTLNKLRAYRLGVGETLMLEDSDIREFDELNQAVNKMVDKINSDYENIKNFSEDVSHEMQTPLAIVKSKIELLRQDIKADDESLKSIATISRAISRLSKLNQSLLLLAKIQNNQYRETKDIHFSHIIREYLEQLNELIDGEEVSVSPLELDDIVLSMNPILAERLVSNLLSNALRHNKKGGFISVYLNALSFVVENTTTHSWDGKSVNLFERMKSNEAKDSTGLGLNIVKSICDNYSFDIDYSYPKEDVFRIEIKFNQA